jgi:hypothetical protein
MAGRRSCKERERIRNAEKLVDKAKVMLVHFGDL